MADTPAQAAHNPQPLADTDWAEAGLAVPAIHLAEVWADSRRSPDSHIPGRHTAAAAEAEAVEENCRIPHHPGAVLDFDLGTDSNHHRRRLDCADSGLGRMTTT